MTEIVTKAQRLRSKEEVLRAFGGGLEGLDYDVAVVSVEREFLHLRYITDRPALSSIQHLTRKPILLPSSATPLGSMQVGRIYDRKAFLAIAEPFLRLFPRGQMSNEVSVSLKAKALALPISVRGQPWGGVALMSHGLADEHLPILRLFAAQLGTALEVAESFEDLQQRNAELELVHEFGRAGPMRDMAALCRRALETVCRSTSSDAAAFHRLEPGANEFVLVGDPSGAPGPSVDALRSLVAPADLPVGAPRSFQAADVLHFPVEGHDDGIQHLCGVPIFIEGQLVGLLSVARNEAIPYVSAEIRTVEILGGQMASFLERARLYEESTRLYAELKTSYDELARTQAELVRHERLAALGELAAIMAHEVRNPLGAIFNSLTTLRRLVPPSSDAIMLLEILDEESERLNHIVGDLLDFSRPYEARKEPTSLSDVISSAIDSATLASASNHVSIVPECDRSLPSILVDARAMVQVIVNLLNNAAQAMPKGGTIVIRGSLDSTTPTPRLRIEVQDEGVGFRPGDENKIFQPFFTTKATGTGLGLAIVRRIVEAHQGEIVARLNPDRGSTFSVWLPAHKSDFS